jgi:hypothetical protein
LTKLNSTTSDFANKKLSLQEFKCILKSEEIQSIIQKAKSSHLLELYSLGLTDVIVNAEINSILDPSFFWIYKAYFSGVNSLINTNLFTDMSTHLKKQTATKNIDGTTVDYFVDKVEGLELVNWCPILGLKGQLDLLMKAKLTFVKDNSNIDENFVKEILLPIEFKTGKWKASTVIGHRAQVMLYIFYYLFFLFLIE